MQSIRTATCGYELRTGNESLSCVTDEHEPHQPPANARFSPQHLYHPPLRSPTSLSLHNRWREPIHVSYLIARGATGWNATPCMGETRGGKRSQIMQRIQILNFGLTSFSVPLSATFVFPSFMFFPPVTAKLTILISIWQGWFNFFFSECILWPWCMWSICFCRGRNHDNKYGASIAF